MTPKKIAIATAAAGLLVTGSAATALGAPSTPTAAPVLAAFSTPMDNNDHDWNHGKGWNGDRRRNGDWDGHQWRWWHDWGIRPDLCVFGGGHVDWRHHECDGGRFDNFKVRWWWR